MRAKRKAYTRENLQRLLIKSTLAQPNSIPAVSSQLESEDFDNDKYKEIYRSILELYSRGTPLTQAELFRYLKYEREIILLEEDLSLFIDPPVDPPTTLAKLLRLESATHKASIAAQQTAEELKETATPLELMGTLQTALGDLAVKLVDDHKATLKERAQAFAEKVLQDEGEDEYVIPTPYGTLNKYLGGGLRPGTMNTVGARTGIGKTVVATQITELACSVGKSVLYFSLEMSSEELLGRLAATHGNIMLNALKPKPGRTDEIKSRIRTAFEEISKWKLTIVDDDDVTMEKVRSVSQQVAQSEDGLDMIVLDYLQLISTKGLQGKSRQEMVAELSRNCKMLSKKLQIPIVILVQLNRESKGEDENRLPSKADIRESAAIAADSDVILILHRKYRDDSTDPKATFILDKNRGGPADKKFKLRCVLEKNMFQDLNDEDFHSENTVAENEIVSDNTPAEVESPPTDFGDSQDISWGSSSSSESIDYDALFDD